MLYRRKCFANGRKHARAGYAVVFPDYPEHNGGYPLEGELQTNNRAEFAGALKAMAIADVLDPQRVRPLHLYTDSELLIKTVTSWIPIWKAKGWRKKDKSEVANLDLVHELDFYMGKRRIECIYVKAHSGHKWNDEADRLAKEGATRLAKEGAGRPTG